MKLRDRKKRKSGSALLVVLGFLSFMVISAVAFAIYMRAERAPSSALRRSTATRHLVKAAMAQAMSRVDDAIRNDPFPGLANTNGNIYANFYHDFDNNSMDLWLGRVFMPPDPAGLVDDDGSRVSGANDPTVMNKFAWRVAPITETVSVLNLEALGYLPPPLVNDVRFLSRSTWTAKWQNFAFDAGRFAFCAVNVSDYFDINRTRVGVRSSPLDSRVSLLGTFSWNGADNKSVDVASQLGPLSALLGPDADRPTYSNGDRDRGGGARNDTEYVSMLDYNLAFGAKPGGVSVLYPFFYEWIDDNENAGARKYFYQTSVETSDSVKQARRQPFVADSFATNETYEIDFATLTGQPYSGIDMKGNVTAQDVLMATGSKCAKRMYDMGLISALDLFTLYDYLDHDDIPLSLAMPSVECVPMVTAVELVGQTLARLKVNPPQPLTGKVETVPRTGPRAAVQTTTMEYQLDQSSFDSDAVSVRVLVSFPFRHFKGRNIDGFKVQVAMKVFVAAGAVSVRPSNDLSKLHPDPQNNGAEWNQPSKEFTINGKAPGNALAWSLYSDKVDIQIPNQCRDQEDALMQIDVNKWNGSARVPGSQPFFTTVKTENGTVDAGGNFTGNGQPPSYTHQFNLRPFNKAGNLMSDGVNQGDIAQAAYAEDQFRTYAMLWIRITDSSGNETYDLAPAVIADDMLNGKNNDNGVITELIGAPAPGCLLFSSDPAKFYTYKNISENNMSGIQGDDQNWTPKALAVVDPRFNYLPEDWFNFEQSISPQAWLGKISGVGYLRIQGDRDPDIFMFTSNQGYLQSIGEFAFLPRLSQWKNQPGGLISTLLQTGGGAEAKHADRPEDILNKNCAWRTYPIVRELDDTHHHTLYDDFAKVGIGRNSDDVQTINPYSDDEAVLMSAFAYTPCDYWTTGRIVAGAKSRGEKLADEFKKIVNKIGDENQMSGDAIGNPSKCLEYSFCEDNNDSSSKMKVEVVRKIMRRFAEAMRADGGRNPWEKIYDGLFDDALADLDGQDNYTKTDNNADEFLGIDLQNCPLYSVDRKFLYSYWRDCFANKQQLFLIFVRAESTSLGGPGEGTPAQQGGRAVALVWREPVAYDDGNNPNSTYSDKTANTMQRQRFSIGRRPHRMRVLFYHQFD